MAKAVFYNLPAYGHVNPTLALVKELVARGDEVIFYTSEEFKDSIEKMGAQFRPYPVPPIFDFVHLSDELFQFALELLQYSHKVLPELIKEAEIIKPDYVLYDSVTFCWSLTIAKEQSIPAVCSSVLFVPAPGYKTDEQTRILKWLGSMFFRSIHTIIYAVFLFFKLKWKYKPDLSLSMDSTRASDLTLVYTSKEIQPKSENIPSKYKFIGPAIDERPYAGDFPLNELQSADRNIVYISLGTINSFGKNQFYQHCFEAFKNSNFIVVLSIGKTTDPNSLGEIPSNFMVYQFVPQLEVLKIASAFITHAGMNGIHEGLYFGVPLLMIPQSIEQTINALRIQDLGAGVYLPHEKVNPQSLRNKMNSIYDEAEVQKAVSHLQNSLHNAGGHKAGADAIKSFLAEQ